MNWSLVRTVAPTLPAMTLQEAKDHLRIEHTDDDSYLEPLIEAATAQLERLTNRAFMTQTLALRLDGFPDAPWLDLPRHPLQSVTSVQYVDDAGATQVWPSASYIVDTFGRPGRLALAYGESWPSARAIVNAATVTYVAGHSANPEMLPRELKQMLALLIGHLYQQREPTTGQPRHALPMGLDSMIWLNRVFGDPG